MIVLLQWFNESVLRSTALVLDIALRSVGAFYFGVRAGAVDAGADFSLSSIISGFIVTGSLAGLLMASALVVRKLRMKNPGPVAIWVGAILFWLGCVIGVYFLGFTFYLLAQPNLPFGIIGVSATAAILYPIAGRVIRYVLGR